MPRLEHVDTKRIGRDHLDAYPYHDDATFKGIRLYVNTYNLSVEEFRNIINSNEIRYFKSYTNDSRVK
jgi:hypothetical protein